MATTFRNQIASINACAAYFAQADYHVTVSFNHYGCNCVVYFDELEKKESIIKSMRCFADPADNIDYSGYKLEDNSTFYTLTLTKEAQP